jgi:hypothetical protein
MPIDGWKTDHVISSFHSSGHIVELIAHAVSKKGNDGHEAQWVLRQEQQF